MRERGKRSTGIARRDEEDRLVFEELWRNEGSNTQASIIEMKQKLPDDGGNAFIVDKGTAKVSWKKDGGVLVVFNRGVRVFKKEQTVSGIAFEYREE